MTDRLSAPHESADLVSPQSDATARDESTLMAAERDKWVALARRVEAGDNQAYNEFRNNYYTGVRVMLKRSLGSVGLEAFVEETLAGAMEEIRKGRIREPREFIRFLRTVIERQQVAATHRQPPWATPVMTTMDRIRMRETARTFERALMSFTKRERDILVGYFSRGLTRHDLECTYGATEAELDSLRSRLQDLIHPHRGHRRMAQARTTPLMRRAAAAS